MIKVTLTRDEIEQAITEYAEDKLFSSGLLRDNNIKVTQGKSASATILVIPNEATKEEEEALIEQADKEIDTIAGQPDIPVKLSSVQGFN
jgi:hypothetical protein